MTVGVGTKEKKEKSMESQAHGIAFAIKETTPDKIIFLVTKESTETLDYVEKYLEDDKENKLRFIRSEKIELTTFSNINTLVKEISDIFEKIKHHKIVVIPTFGTKAMSIGLSIAGVLYNAEIYSIEGDRGEDNLVIPGTERLEQQNLWWIKNVFLLEKAKASFNAGRFGLAMEYLNQITKTKEFKEIVSNMETIIQSYEEWDRFNHKKAYEKMRELPKDKIELYRLNKNFKFLETLYSLSRKVENIEDESQIRETKSKIFIHLIFDLYSNAIRRFKEGKYDDCMARFYRIIEFIGQYILWRDYNIVVSEAFGELSEVSIWYDLKIKSNIEDKISFEEFEKKYFNEEGKLKIGLNQCYSLLEDLGVKIIDDENQFKKILYQRNNSILAHGSQPIKKESCEEAKEFVENLLKFLCKKENIDFEEIKEMTTFIKLPESARLL